MSSSLVFKCLRVDGLHQNCLGSVLKLQIPGLQPNHLGEFPGLRPFNLCFNQEQRQFLFQPGLGIFKSTITYHMPDVSRYYFLT